MTGSEASGSEAEFEVLACFPSHVVPRSNTDQCEEQDNVVSCIISDESLEGGESPLTPHDTSDGCSVITTDSSEASSSLDDGIMIISNHFGQSLEYNDSNLHPELDGISDQHTNTAFYFTSLTGWQELSQITEHGTYTFSDEPYTAAAAAAAAAAVDDDDDAGIVTISDEADPEGRYFLDVGQYQVVDEKDNLSDHSDSSSFVFDSSLFSISEEIEGFDLDEISETEAVKQELPEDLTISVEENEKDKEEVDSDVGDDDGGGDGGGGGGGGGGGDDGDDDDDEPLVHLSIDAPTLVILLCLTTALGFSIGHGR